MATYDEMAKKVLSWSNRDTEVISYRDIKDFINFGTDNAYRELRIAPMESLRTYTISGDGGFRLTLPSDFIEPIQLRMVSDASTTNRFPATQYKIYNAKSDVRSFYDEYLPQYSDRYFSREQNTLILSPSFSDSEVYELYYYRRLPEADARYAIDTDEEETTTQYYATSKTALMDEVKAGETSTVFDTDPDLEGTIQDSDGHFRLGKLTGNWLRDDNEKVILYGALMQAGIFLADEMLINIYTDRFNSEIKTLNMEDNRRQLRGGNAQQRFSGGGLI